MSVVWVPKFWGGEEIVVNNNEYCGKKLLFIKGKSCSLHYHIKKLETFYVLEGCVQMQYYEYGPELEELKMVKAWSDDSILNKCKSVMLNPGDSFEVPRLLAHKVTALQESKIIEFSTHHEDSDSIRIIKGN